MDETKAALVGDDENEGFRIGRVVAFIRHAGFKVANQYSGAEDGPLVTVEVMPDVMLLEASRLRSLFESWGVMVSVPDTFFDEDVYDENQPRIEARFSVGMSFAGLNIVDKMLPADVPQWVP